MNLRDLEYLVAVADHLNFHRAAEACNIGQPTLSTQIRKLEEELGVTLIERGQRKVFLTDIGADIVARARLVLAEIEQMRQVARADTAQRNRLRLGIFPTLGPYVLPHIVPGFRRQFPNVELLLTEEKSGVLRQQLASGQLDAILLADPIGNRYHTEMSLFDEPFLLAVPSGHRLAGQDSITPEDLKNERLMLLEEGHCMREQALTATHIAGAREEKNFRATSLETLRQMVAAGVGITYLPALACLSTTTSDGYAVIPLRGATFERHISLHWRSSSPMGPLLADFGAMIRTEISAVLENAGFRRPR